MDEIVEMFSGSVNPITGKQEWLLQDRDVTCEEADISHELARSQYGDMLHDRERVSYLASLILYSTCTIVNL